MGVDRSPGLAVLRIAVLEDARRLEVGIEPDLRGHGRGFGAVAGRQKERGGDQRATTAPQMFVAGIARRQQPDIGMAAAVERAIGDLRADPALAGAPLMAPTLRER